MSLGPAIYQSAPSSLDFSGLGVIFCHRTQ